MVKELKSYRDRSGHDVRIREDGSRDVSLSFKGDPGKTEQSHLPTTSIEYLVRLHSVGGQKMVMPESDFQDFTRLPATRTECLEFILDAEEMFESLPLEARKAYDHDIGRFLAAIDDPSQRDDLIKLGVFKPMDGALKGTSEPDVKSTPAEGGQTAKPSDK